MSERTQERTRERTTEHISEEELRREYARLDAIRNEAESHLMNREQYLLVHYAVTGVPRIPWKRIVEYWAERGWGDVKLSTLKNRYYNTAANGGY